MIQPDPRGRTKGRDRVRQIVEAHAELGGIEIPDHVAGAIAIGVVDALLDEKDGFDSGMARCFDVVADAAHDACAEHGVSKLRKIDRSEPFGAGSVNGRIIAGEVLRAAIKAGLVTASDRALRFIAASGSAGHDDTVASLRAAITHAAKAQPEDAEAIHAA